MHPHFRKLYFGNMTWIAPLLILLFCGMLPWLTLVVLSIAEWDDSGHFVKWFTINGYNTLLKSHRLATLRIILCRSLFVTLINICIAVPVAFAVVRLIGKRARLFYLMGITVPFCVSDVTRAFAWQLILDRHGLINRVILCLGFLNRPIDWFLYSEFGVTLALIAATLPFALFPIVLVASTIPETVWAASEDLGTTRFREFYRLAIPLFLPGVVIGALASFVSATSSVCEATMLGGPAQMSIGKMLSQLEGARQMGAIYAMASSTLVAAIIIVGLLVYLRSRQITGRLGS